MFTEGNLMTTLFLMPVLDWFRKHMPAELFEEMAIMRAEEYT